ncbi:hypothetical protein D3C87_1275250 [compost metagenome]
MRVAGGGTLSSEPTVTVVPSARATSPAAKKVMSSKTPEPGRASNCQKKLMGPVIAPPVAVLLASVMSAADTVSRWPTAGVGSSILSEPTGSAFKPPSTSA